MNIKCKHCGADNFHEKIMCDICSTSMWSKDEIVTKLSARLDKLETSYKSDIAALKRDISLLNTGAKPIPDANVIQEKKVPPVHQKINETPAYISTDDNLFRPRQSKLTPLERKGAKPKTQYQPSQFDLKLKEVLGPLNAGFELFLGVYKKYKKEGKLPIFFMTIAGIVAILFGFGYLMQVSLANFGDYEEVAKIVLGFISSIILAGIGMRLSSKGESLKEYGSALISLGIILNYVMIYFMSDLGNFPVLSSAVFGFLLICLNTIVSVFFSLKYEAKVIAVISLIGGAFAPLYLNANEDGTLYFLFLWMLTAGSCYVSQKIEWKTHSYLTIVVAMGCLEFMVFNQNPNDFIFTAYYHLFAYLFFYLALFNGQKLKETLVKEDIIILTSTLAFFLYNLYSSFDTSLVALGIVYLANTVLFSGLLLAKWKELSRDIKLVLFIVGGALLGFAIPSIFDQALMGLFWSIEALLLVVLGFYFTIPTVRKEGYILLAIAFGKLALSSASIVVHWNETIWHQGFLNYIALGAVFSSLWFVGRKYKQELVEFEISLFAISQELVPLWLASVYLMVGYHMLGEWIYNLSIIPLFGFIYWKKHFKTKLSDIIGLAHIVLFLLGFIRSIQETGSIHFSDQKLFAQIGMLELMGVLWVLKAYFQRLKIEEHKSYKFTESLRVAFFCLLPLIFVHLIKRHAFDFIELGCWIGAVMTYFLHKKLNYSALKIELYILSAGALTICFMEWDPFGFISGMAFIIGIVVSEKAIDYEILQKSTYKDFINLLPFVFSAFIGSLIFSFDDDLLALGMSLTSLSLLALTFFYDKIGPAKMSISYASFIALLLNLVSLFTLILLESIPSMICAVVNLIIIGFLLNNKKNWFLILYGAQWNTTMVIHQISCIVAYGIILGFAGIDLTGPVISILLAAHAIVVLFVAMKNQIKVLNKISIALFAATLLKVVFHDINGFATTEKVVVLIILGLILLSASYGYVKMAKYFEEKAKLNQPEVRASSSSDIAQ